MNKSHIIILVIGLAMLIIGNAVYSFFNLRQEYQTSEQNIKLEDKSDFAPLAAETQTCHWEENGSQVTAYLDQGKIRLISISDKETSHALYKDGCFWQWTEGASQGYLQCFLNQSNPEATSSFQILPDQNNLNLDISCDPEAPDPSLFDPPEINFIQLE